MADLIRAWTPVLLALFAAGAVLVAVGLLGRFLVRGLDLEPLDCDEDDDLGLVADAVGVTPLEQRTKVWCFDAECRICQLRKERAEEEK